MKNVKYRGIPRNKDDFRGEFRGSNSAVKTQIPRLGSKFRGRGKLWALIIMHGRELIRTIAYGFQSRSNPSLVQTLEANSINQRIIQYLALIIMNAIATVRLHN